MAEPKRLLEEAYLARVQNLPKAIELANLALLKANELGDGDSVAWAQSSLGLFYMIRGEYEESIRLSNEAIEYFTIHNDAKGLAHARYNIGSVYYRSNHFHEGLNYLLQCLSSFREIKDHHNIARVLKSMGTIYEFFGDEDSALASYEGSIEAAQEVEDFNSVTNAYNPLSGIYLKRNENSKARALAIESIATKKRTGDTRGLAFSIYALAKVEHKEGNFEKAEENYLESLRINLEMGDHLGQGMVYNKLGLLNYEQNKFSESKEHLTKALDLAHSYNIQVILYKAHYNLYLLFKRVGQHTEALMHLEKFLKEKGAVINSNTLNVIKSYQIERKIKTLENQAAIQKSKNEITEKKNAELDSFFYRVSHDLKGPISSLLGLHNLVKLEVKDPLASSYFDMYESQVRRVNKIVMDLIDLTNMSNQTVASVAINFQSLLEECISSYRYLENFGKIKFEVNVKEPIHYNAEWAIVNTVLQNLIENSIKYSRFNSNPFIKVDIQQLNDQIIIDVEDNGQGIHPDHQDKIFNMFYRASTGGGGSGLGLYILKRAVERLDGKITFTSYPSKGTHFTIKLPVKRELIFQQEEVSS